MPGYRRSQQSRFIRVIFAMAVAITIIAVFLAGPPADMWILLLVCVCAAAGFAIAMQFSSLTAEVDNSKLRWWFGRGVWRKSVHLADVASATPVRNRWWWGWGIRYYGKGWPAY